MMDDLKGLTCFGILFCKLDAITSRSRSKFSIADSMPLIVALVLENGLLTRVVTLEIQTLSHVFAHLKMWKLFIFYLHRRTCTRVAANSC